MRKAKNPNPPPRSKDWKMQFKLRAYRGQIIAPEEMTTHQLMTFTRWADDYLHWKYVHRIKIDSFEIDIEQLADYRVELQIRRLIQKNKRYKKL